MNKFAKVVMPILNTVGNYDIDPESAAAIGWEECKKEVLKIFEQESNDANYNWKNIVTILNNINKL